MKNKKRFPMPLDDKNLSTDFEWLTDNGVENKDDHRRLHHEVLFWWRGCACLLTWMFGDNKYSVELLQGSSEKINEMNDMFEELKNFSWKEDQLDVEVKREGNKFTLSMYTVEDI